ncbi:hypothetical protein AN644_04000 [Candidatus Epulonipiscium fishelsonii]|nr:hypothetical protein AN644_04000 [Epulopiscium sp. SCG-C06WGA-EpuloA1]
MNAKFSLLNLFRNETAEWDTKTWQTLLLSAIGAGISLYKYYPGVVDEFQQKFVSWINADKKDEDNSNPMLALMILGVVLIYFNNLTENTKTAPALPKLDEEILPLMPEVHEPVPPVMPVPPAMPEGYKPVPPAMPEVYKSVPPSEQPIFTVK